MTEIDLQLDIQKVLTDEIFPKLTIFQPGEMQVFLQDIPLSTDFEDEDDKYFPCCIVRLRGGKINTASEPQITTIEIIVCIKDWSDDMTGYQSLMVTLQRIRDYFSAAAGIREKHRLVYPIEFNINEEAATPYFIGNVVTKWQTDVMEYKDLDKLL